MRSLLEIHILQNMAPASLNQDEAGNTKSCLFGGFRRARVSSQSWKRAMRTFVKENELLPASHLSVRSRVFRDRIAHALAAQGRDIETTQKVVDTALAALGLNVSDGETSYLVVLADSEYKRITTLLDQHWDQLAEPLKTGGGRRGRQRAGTLPDGLETALRNSLVSRESGGDAVDLALFGRMLANLRDKSPDGACHVAHALSTHVVEKEYDFFTALDDLLCGTARNPVGMLDSIEFNSACYYRYLTVDLSLLRSNLRDDSELILHGLQAFVRAAMLALPSGKQGPFAAHNPPGFVALRRRQGWAPLNLSNAFETPVRATPEASLTLVSQRRLSEHWLKMDELCRAGGDTVYWAAEGGFTPGRRASGMDELLAALDDWASP